MGALFAAEKPVWEPAKTWVFAVGVLRFEGAKENDWPEEGRRDAVMIEALKARGVPAGQIVFLKNEQAKLSDLQKRFSALVATAGPEDTLLFYYAGHGGRNYDIGVGTGWLGPPLPPNRTSGVTASGFPVSK